MPGLTNNRYTWAKLVSGFLNTEFGPAIGTPLSSAQFSGGIVESYPGQLGVPFDMSEDDAAKMSNTSVATLHGGTYMFVGIRPADAGAYKRGQIVFWDQTVNPDLYQVTNTEALASNGGVTNPAGIIINPTTTPASAVITPATYNPAPSYAIIQVAGLALVQFRASITGTPAIGASVICAAAGAGADNCTADIATTSAVTASVVALQLERNIGIARTLPANSTISQVDLSRTLMRRF